MKETRPRKPSSKPDGNTTLPGKSAGGLDRNMSPAQSREKAILLRISNETTRVALAREGPPTSDAKPREEGATAEQSRGTCQVS